MYGDAVHPVPPLLVSPICVTVGVASQLSASVVTTLISGAGTPAIHCTSTDVGFDAVGAVLSDTLNTWFAVLAFPHASVIV